MSNEEIHAETAHAVDVVETYWQQLFASWVDKYTGQPSQWWTPVRWNGDGFYDSPAGDDTTCNSELITDVKAGFCPDGTGSGRLSWDMELLREETVIGDSPIYLVVAHEYGHAAQSRFLADGEGPALWDAPGTPLYDHRRTAWPEPRWPQPSGTTSWSSSRATSRSWTRRSSPWTTRVTMAPRSSGSPRYTRATTAATSSPVWESDDLQIHNRTSGLKRQKENTMARFISLAGALLVTLALTLGIAPSASAAAQPVRIIKVQYDSPGTDTRTNASINAEYVIIKNFSTTTRTLTNWTLRDKQGHIYKFPTFRLAAGKTVVVRSGKGTATQITRYFNSGNYIWNNTGDAAILRTNTGASVSTCAWATITPGYKNCP